MPLTSDSCMQQRFQVPTARHVHGRRCLRAASVPVADRSRLFQPRGTICGRPRGDLVDQPASSYWSGGVFGVISECGTARLGSAAPAGYAPCRNSKTIPSADFPTMPAPPRSGPSPQRIAGLPPFDHRCDQRATRRIAPPLLRGLRLQRMAKTRIRRAGLVEIGGLGPRVVGRAIRHKYLRRRLWR